MLRIFRVKKAYKICRCRLHKLKEYSYLIFEHTDICPHILRREI